MGRRPKADEPVFSRIEELRAERGLSRQELADAVGVHYQTVGYLERGEYSPSLSLALRLAEVLEAPVEQMFSLTPFPEYQGDPMTLKERWTASKERNEAAVAASAEKLMADTAYDRYRTPRARVLLVVGYLALLVLIPVAYLAINQFVGLLVVLVTAGVWSLLRVSVRTIADLPDEYLDERQLAVRNASYVESYRYLGGAVALAGTAGLIAFIVNGTELDTWDVTLTWEAAMSSFWVFLGLALGLPSMVLALNDRV